MDNLSSSRESIEEKKEMLDIVKSFLNYEFNERTKEQFENDLESALTLLNEYGT